MPRTGQRWILETFVSVAGMDVLHPGFQGLLEAWGYNHSDVECVLARAKRGNMLTKAWTVTAQEIERKAQYAEERGFKLAARDMYIRASLLYGRAQYTIYGDDPLKTALHGKMVDCYEKVIEYNPTPIERITIPFEGKSLYCVLHLPADTARRVPCALLVPGLDMFKEDYHQNAQRNYVPRGMAAMSIDGPGQGESLLHGLKVTVDSYERAASAVLDYLSSRPEIDPDKFVLFGSSWGSYTGSRIAAHDPRIRGCALCMGAYENTFEHVFTEAQPNFKVNFMFITGIQDEKEFDQKLLPYMNLRDIIPKIKCPYLVIHGEFDELCPAPWALAHYQKIEAPKELWLYEDDFHPLGRVADEMMGWGADWLLQILEGRFKPDMDNRIFIRPDGTYLEGTGRPPWWLA